MNMTTPRATGRRYDAWDVERMESMADEGGVAAARLEDVEPPERLVGHDVVDSSAPGPEPGMSGSTPLVELRLAIRTLRELHTNFGGLVARVEGIARRVEAIVR